MAENETKGLPAFRTLDELVEFFDTHDMGEYWDEMPEAHFEIDIQKRAYLVAIDAEIVDKLSEIARAKQTSTGVLVNSWLREKIREMA